MFDRIDKWLKDSHLCRMIKSITLVMLIDLVIHVQANSLIMLFTAHLHLRIIGGIAASAETTTIEPIAY